MIGLFSRRRQRDTDAGRVWGTFAQTPQGKTPVGPCVCFVGDGCSGSWQIRAEQIAGMRSEWAARPAARLRSRDLSRFDVFVFVKRFDEVWAKRMRRRGRIVVYDVLDTWRQPDDGLACPTLPDVHRFFRNHFDGLPLDGVIFPNRAMYDDLGAFVPNPVAIHHHAWPKIAPLPVKLVPQFVGYEGREEYLGDWRSVIESVCRRLGLAFIVNPLSLTELDIGFIARSGEHGTLMATRYKSNVKLANLLAAGVPAVVQAGEASYEETAGGLVSFFSSREELEAAMRKLLPYSTRLELHNRMLVHAREFHIERIAEQYAAYFRSLVAV